MKIFLILVYLTIGFSVQAAWFTNSAEADAFVRATAPTSNYGGAGALSVSGTNAVNASGVTNGAFDSFIRFNCGAMLTSFNSSFGPNNWVINGARLRVTEMGAPLNALFNRGIGAFEIRWIANDNWVEGTGVPNAPATSGIAYRDETILLNSAADARLGIFTNSGLDATLSFPLGLPTAFVDDVKGGGQVGLYMTAVNPAVGFTIDSLSFGTVAARPYLEISAVTRPGIASLKISGTDVVLEGTNGVAGATYYTLSSTNLILPLNEWQPVATNVLGASGAFEITLTNAAKLASPQPQLFILQTQ